MNGLMGKITDSLIDLIYWLTNGAIGKLIDWLIDWLISGLLYSMGWVLQKPGYDQGGRAHWVSGI